MSLFIEIQLETVISLGTLSFSLSNLPHVTARTECKRTYMCMYEYTVTLVSRIYMYVCMYIYIYASVYIEVLESTVVGFVTGFPVIYKICQPQM